jgi:hypothetical protein
MTKLHRLGVGGVFMRISGSVFYCYCKVHVVQVLRGVPFHGFLSKHVPGAYRMRNSAS